MKSKDLLKISLRYLIALLLGLPNLFLFYLIFTPLTVSLSFFFLKILYNAELLTQNTFLLGGGFISLIPACIAGSAYYLLTVLNLTTPLNTRTRIYSLIFILGSFLALNTLRIIIFASLIFKGYQYFDVAHAVSWYFGSTVLVVLIWFSNVLIFKINSIPVYTDIRRINSR